MLKAPGEMPIEAINVDEGLLKTNETAN